MKHQSSKTLYDYWQRLRGDRPAPQRTEIEPSDIRGILSETFILECADETTYPFRLAGTRICSTYCRELKGRNFLDFWTGDDREALETLLLAIHDEAGIAVIGFEGLNTRKTPLSFELILLPLATKQDDTFPRIVGTLSAMEYPYWQGVHPIQSQRITAMRLIWPDEKPHFLRKALRETAPSAVPSIVTPTKQSWRRGHLTVYEGGKSV